MKPYGFGAFAPRLESGWIEKLPDKAGGALQDVDSFEDVAEWVNTAISAASTDLAGNDPAHRLLTYKSMSKGNALVAAGKIAPFQSYSRGWPAVVEAVSEMLNQNNLPLLYTSLEAEVAAPNSPSD